MIKNRPSEFLPNEKLKTKTVWKRKNKNGITKYKVSKLKESKRTDVNEVSIYRKKKEVKLRGGIEPIW